MPHMVSVSAFLELDDTIQNPEKVGAQAAAAIAKLLHDTYVVGAKDSENPTVRTSAITYHVEESVVLPSAEKKKK